MPKLYSSKRICKILAKNGFCVISQKGSYLKYFNYKTKSTVIIPANKREIPFGTFRSIIRQSKLNSENFTNNRQDKNTI